MMQNYTSFFASNIINLIECTDDITCPVRPSTAPIRIDDEYVYTEMEERELRNANIMLGAIYWGLSYVPIMTWYLWRRPNIRASMDINPWYNRAWNVMWMLHYFVF